MSYWDDDETETWRRSSRTNPDKRDWDDVRVEFETRRGHASLTWKEWRQLQRFLREYDIAETFKIMEDDYKHLPRNVILVIEDWLKQKAGVPFKY